MRYIKLTTLSALFIISVVHYGFATINYREEAQAFYKTNIHDTILSGDNKTLVIPITKRFACILAFLATKISTDEEERKWFAISSLERVLITIETGPICNTTENFRLCLETVSSIVAEISTNLTISPSNFSTIFYTSIETYANEFSTSVKSCLKDLE